MNPPERPLTTAEDRNGTVVYIAAVGAFGMGVRYAAWCDRYNGGLDIPDLYARLGLIFPTEDGAFVMLQNTMREYAIMRPAALFLGTLAQCYGRGNKNSNMNAQEFIYAFTQIAVAVRTTIVLVHHSSWKEERMRGASAFQGAVDSILQLVGGVDQWQYTLRCDKSRDRAPPKPLVFRTVPGSTRQYWRCGCYE